MGQDAVVQEIESFLRDWSGEEQPMRDWFSTIFTELTSIDGVEMDFVSRPGVSYSMRPKHPKQKGRDLFAMVDVIDDDPDGRWLSVCFYGDMITDPEERGEVIPGGLSGDDGYCFDMFDNDESLAKYLLTRLKEAAVNASR